MKKLTLLFAMLAVIVTTAMADNVIFASDLKIATTGKADLLINLSNSEAIRGVQLTLTLPDNIIVQESNNGIAYNDGEDKVYTPDDGVKVLLTDRLSSEWSVIGRKKSANTYVFVLISLTGAEIAAGEGSIMKIGFQTSEVTTGNYPVKITDIHLASSTGVDVALSEITNDFTVLKKGDVNGDNKTNVTDAVCIINYMYQQPNSQFYDSIADVNMDGKINVSDAVSIINIMYGETPALSRGFNDDDFDMMIDPE